MSLEKETPREESSDYSVWLFQNPRCGVNTWQKEKRKRGNLHIQLLPGKVCTFLCISSGDLCVEGLGGGDKRRRWERGEWRDIRRCG